jgi:hypothetical protein
LAPRLPTLKKKDSTPARQVSGTGYTGTPAPNVKPPSLDEMGSAKGTVIRDIVPALANRQQAVRTYRTMTRSDASVKISLRAGKTPVLGGTFYIDAFDEQEQNQVIQEFVDFNIFHATTSPFLQTLEDILRMFENGFQVLEPVYELREWSPKKSSPTANRRAYTMLRKLSPRPSTTISEFLYDDNGGPAGVKHVAINAKNATKEVEIPIEKLMVFTFDRDGGNLEGESILRSAYQHWFYKDIFYKIDGIQKERHGTGVPHVELPPGFTQKDIDAAWTLVRGIRTNEEAGIVTPPGYKVSFAKVEGQLTNALESAAHHDNMIMKNVMVQFLNLGMEGSGGGRATGATAADMFLKSMRYIGNMICDSFNRYLIPNLVAYNFPTDQFPQMKVRNIGEVKDLQQWATAMANLVQQGLITMDLETEQFIRNIVDMPNKIGDRPEFTPQQQRENILLQGQYQPGDKTTPGGVVVPPGAKTDGTPTATTGKQVTGVDQSKSPTSGN